MPAPTLGRPEPGAAAQGRFGGGDVRRPDGVRGGERYQYPFDSEEGRAISARCVRIVQDGRAPDTIVMQTFFWYRPLLEEPVREGAPSVLGVFEEETGIGVRFTELEYTLEVNRPAAEARDGSFDVVAMTPSFTSEFAETGHPCFGPLDELVDTYRPSWLDPVFGYVGGEHTARLYSTYRSSTYLVAFDSDPQLVAYRADLLEDPAEGAAFADRYGRELRFPLTWDEQAEVAEFFHRPDADPPLYGSVERKDPAFGFVNWMQRFVCSGNPNFYYFSDDGSANVNNEAGIRAAEEHKRSLQWSEPGALENPFDYQWELMAQGSGFMGGGCGNVFNHGRPEPPLLLKAEVMPGRIVGGALIRRPVHFLALRSA